MARARNIKPGFFKNADLVELPIEARLLFIGLWTLADRGGRLEDRPKQIKMELFPADPVDVDACLDGLQRWGFVQRYEVAGRRLLQVVNFDKHQNPHRDEKVSALPSPDGSFDEARCKHGASTVQKQCSDVAGTVGIGLIPDSMIPDSPIPEEEKTARKRAARKCPESFSVTPGLEQWAAENAPGVDLKRETDKFRDYTFKTAHTDWDGAWRNWIRKAADSLPRARASPGESFRERDARLERERYAELTGKRPGLDENTIDMPGQLALEHER